MNGEWSIKDFVAKMKGRSRTPLKISGSVALIGGLGGLVTIGVLGMLAELTTAVWLMASFGASCVLAFVAWDSPLSQPRNIIGGHFFTSLVGVLLYQIGGSQLWVVALSVGLAIVTMHVTKTTHPPAGANPIVIVMDGKGWEFLLSPVLIGAVVVVLIALFVNNMHKKRAYPVFWV
ncbi:HPP family protein [Brevibacillus sp. HB2.2]|uniref:HPP family protein n=1 Tax=Brevibacillus sp. HB2.2 TaxID=2738846 RepID=UPI00156BCA13|nr:HPP family protein [Brevibacillus sp. HB2.2]NRS51060.1 HPP family protein [Brevibacillus sp. HB2.2]